jgi:DNA-binding NarL/FixJ family response regulator
MSTLHDTLSPRELEILKSIGRGLTVSQIAECLGLSVKTVSEYRRRVLEKLLLAGGIDAATTTALIRYALKSGLVQ